MKTFTLIFGGSQGEAWSAQEPYFQKSSRGAGIIHIPTAASPLE